MKASPHPQETPRTRPDDRFAWPAIVIFLIALLMRAIHLGQIRRAPFFTVLMGDSRAYDDWAQQIARGDWLGHEVFYQAPLYPYVLAAIYSIGGRDLLIVRICQAIVGSLACVILGFAGRRFFSRTAGIAAGLMLALYAPAIFFDGLIQKSVLDVFFVCLTLALLGRLVVEPEGRLPWLWLGAAAGALTLTRENALVFVTVIILWAVMRQSVAGSPAGGVPGAAAALGCPGGRHWGPTKEGVAAVAIFLVGLTAVLLPVTVRNSIVGGEFHLTTSQFGPNFYIGNNERADGTYMSLRFGRGAPEYERQDATELAEQAMGRRLTPGEVSRYWTDRALAYIRSQPAAWLRLLGRKAALTWNATEMLDTESQATHAEWSAPLRLAGRVGHFGVLVPLALFGVWVTWPQRSKLWVLYAMVLAYAGTLVIFYVFARYRYPLVPLLVLLAAAGLANMRQFFRVRSGAQACGSLVAIGTAASVTNWPLLSIDLMRAITENNLGAALYEQSNFEQAAAHYRRAIVVSPDYAPAHNNLGVVLRAQGHLDEAIEQYEEALRVHPEYPDAHYNLANALHAQGKYDPAIAHFRLALQSMPGSVEAHTNLGIALEAHGELDEAIAQFREAVRLEPDTAKTHENLGKALASRGDLDDAIDHLRRAVQIAPDDGGVHYDLASSLLERGRFEEAVTEFKASLRLMPNSVEAHNNLGVALASQGKIEEAIDQFQQALKLQPDFAGARRNLAIALQARH